MPIQILNHKHAFCNRLVVLHEQPSVFKILQTNMKRNTRKFMRNSGLSRECSKNMLEEAIMELDLFIV